MISEAVSVLLKVGLQMVIWVFVLSIKVENKLIFDHAHDFLVKNQIVASLQNQFGELWDGIIKTAKSGVENAPEKQKDLL